jgi:hypothetical protein
MSKSQVGSSAILKGSGVAKDFFSVERGTVLPAVPVIVVLLAEYTIPSSPTNYFFTPTRI